MSRYEDLSVLEQGQVFRVASEWIASPGQYSPISPQGFLNALEICGVVFPPEEVVDASQIYAEYVKGGVRRKMEGPLQSRWGYFSTIKELEYGKDF